MPSPYIYRSSKLERIYFGEPAAAAVAAEVALCEASRILLLSNQSLAREASLLASISTALGERCVGRITTLKAHSPSADVIQVATAADDLKADLLLAVGGGSVIDTAKVALVAAIEDRKTLDRLKTLTPYGKVDQSRSPPATGSRPLRLIVVPTTLSSAEYSWGASYTDEAAAVKYAIGHPLMAPQAVILDPRAPLTAPAALYFGSGMRSLDHAASRLASLRGTPFSDANAGEALRLLNGALRRVKADRGDLAAGLDAQTGSWLSIIGQATGVSVGASHPIGRILSYVANVPHGLTSCALLPAVMRWNISANEERQKRIAAALDAPGTPAADAIGALGATLGLPGRLRDLGVTPDMLREIAQKSFGEASIRTNPRPIHSAEDILEILNLAW